MEPSSSLMQGKYAVQLRTSFPPFSLPSSLATVAYFFASPLSLLASLHSFLSISPPRNSPFNAEDLRKTRYHARFSATKERSLCLTLCVLSFYERHTRVTLNMTRGKALSFSLRVLEKNKVSARSQGN